MPRCPSPPICLPAVAVALLALALSACVPAHRRPSWAVYPLQRQQPHDGLAVVSQPDGYGLHIWLETDTNATGICQPRWMVDPARLFNGDGSAPFSSGRASRAEFFAAVGRADVRRALRRESEALCRRRHPQRRFRWLEPPRSAAALQSELWPLLQEADLLSDPKAIKAIEQQLLNPGGTSRRPSSPARPD
ncbi:MAG: hypothetical protein QM522_02820 [Chitinophagaceae bacterium]|nr:hypothetical protein [Chitinophagaceae bacterium]